MSKLRIVVFSLTLVVAMFPSGSLAGPTAVSADCIYGGGYGAANQIYQLQTFNEPHVGSVFYMASFFCQFTIVAHYNPTSTTLDFTVTATFSGGGTSNCPPSFNYGYGTIGPFVFYMDSGQLIVGGSPFGVTYNGGNNWTGTGQITGVTGFDCASWQLQGSASGYAAFPVPSGSACLSQYITCTAPANYFSCTCG